MLTESQPHAYYGLWQRVFAHLEVYTNILEHVMV